MAGLFLLSALFLLDGMADDPLCLLENEKPCQSEWMVFVWNFCLDGDAGLLRIDGGFRDQGMSV